MWRQIVQEAPAFFSYYNIVFVLQAALTTVALSAIGCVLGVAFGGLLTLLPAMLLLFWIWFSFRP